MALIKCPECQKEISDKSKQCIHCGYPLIEDNNICVINGQPYDLTFVYNYKDKKLFAIAELMKMTNCTIFEAEQVINQIFETNEIPKVLYLQTKQQESSRTQTDTRPKCPTCGSTNIEKISLTKKAVGGFMFGILSSDVRKTMHCKKCGYKW